MIRIAFAFVLLLLMHPAQAQLRGHGGPVRALAVSADGQTAVSGSFDSSAIRWSLTRNAAEQVLRFHDDGQGLSFIARLSLSPTFALVGARADDFAAVRVSHGGTMLLEAPLSGRDFRWPAGTAPLVANTDYELVLVPKVEGKAQVTLKFRTERGTPTHTLIKVD